MSKLPKGLKELNVVQAYLMEGEIDKPGHEDEVLIQLNDKFYDATECSDEDLLELMKANQS